MHKSRDVQGRYIPRAQKRVIEKIYMWEEIGRALCLLLVIEGILPFLYPTRWRLWIATIATMNDRQLRMMGLASMLIGVGLLFVLK